MSSNILAACTSNYWMGLLGQARRAEPGGSPIWSYLVFIFVTFCVVYLVVKGIRK